MQLSTQVIGIAVGAVIVASVVSDRMASRDLALSGAKDFVANAPEVIAAAGLVESIRPVGLGSGLSSARKDDAGTRKYRLEIAGTKGSVVATVEAVRASPDGPWRYQVVSMDQRSR